MCEKDIVHHAREVFKVEIEALRFVAKHLDRGFAEVVHRCRATVVKGGHVVVSGIGKSGHVARKISATLSSTGSPSVFLNPVEAMHGDLGVLGWHDLFLALSYSGETDELLQVIPAVRRRGIPVVAVTGDPQSRLAECSDLVLLMRVPREACPFNLAPTATTTAMLALGDALAMALLHLHDFCEDDYARLHPSGAIGRSITLRVGDIMRRGDRFATVGPGTSVRECLLRMTETHSGAVAVVGAERRLLGVFTDGDLRRHITEDGGTLDVPVGEVMTPRPVTIPEDALAVELVKLLEHTAINAVLVVDGGNRAVGLVDMQDLPKFKIL